MRHDGVGMQYDNGAVMGARSTRGAVTEHDWGGAGPPPMSLSSARPETTRLVLVPIRVRVPPRMEAKESGISILLGGMRALRHQDTTCIMGGGEGGFGCRCGWWCLGVVGGGGIVV